MEAQPSDNIAALGSDATGRIPSWQAFSVPICKGGALRTGLAKQRQSAGPMLKSSVGMSSGSEGIPTEALGTLGGTPNRDP